VSVWQLPAWVDGRITTAGEPTIALSDVGFRSGLGVFETMRVEGDSVLGLTAHLARLQVGADRIGTGLDPTTLPTILTAALGTLLAVARGGTEADLVARVTVTGGPLAASANWPPQPVGGAGGATIAITLHIAPSLPLPPATAVRVAGLRWPADVKSTSYLSSVLATREAQAQGADVAVFHAGDELLEAAEGNLLLLGDGWVVTPATDGRVLAGVTRGLVLDVARAAGLQVVERSVWMSDLTTARALITTSAVQRIREITRLDDLQLPGDAPTVRLLRDGLAGLARAASPLPMR
jgi:branched-subunit amino acid aminotransferase/4-amino-4-deoxychorismate lyase